MICTKTAYRDLGMIHWLRVKQRKDRKPRKGPMKVPYWCKDCQAYHLRKVAILLILSLSAVPVLAEPQSRQSIGVTVAPYGLSDEAMVRGEAREGIISNPDRLRSDFRGGRQTFYRVKESKHYDPEQGLIPIKFYGRLC